MQMPFTPLVSPWYLPGISLVLPGISLVSPWSPSSVSSPMLLRSGQAVVLAVAISLVLPRISLVSPSFRAGRGPGRGCGRGHSCGRARDHARLPPRHGSHSCREHSRTCFRVRDHEASEASEPFHFQTTTLREYEAQVLEITLEHHLRQIHAFVSIRLARW